MVDLIVADFRGSVMTRRTASALATSGDVLRLIRTGEAVTRADIGRVTGLSRPAVALRVGELL
jgi:hypothetical protein